jgi:hypothetical protein
MSQASAAKMVAVGALVVSGVDQEQAKTIVDEIGREMDGVEITVETAIEFMQKAYDRTRDADAAS